MIDAFSYANATHAGATALLLDEEGVPEGGGRFALRVTYGSAIGSMGINKKRAARLFFYLFALWGNSH